MELAVTNAYTLVCVGQAYKQHKSRLAVFG